MIKLTFLISLVCVLSSACSREADSTTNTSEITTPTGKAPNGDGKPKKAEQANPRLGRTEANTSEFPGAKVLAKRIGGALIDGEFKPYEKALVFTLPREEVREVMLLSLRNNRDMFKKQAESVVRNLAGVPETDLEPSEKKMLVMARQFATNPDVAMEAMVEAALKENLKTAEEYEADFKTLQADLSKAGEDLKKAKVGSVNLSGINPPNRGNVKMPLAYGEAVIQFTIEDRPMEASLVLPVINLPKHGWCIAETPLVSRRALEEPSQAHDDSYDENWSRNLEAAQAKAKESGKLVFVDFTGSDWCSPCMALHENILTQKLFLDFAATHFELVVLDFPRERKMDETQRIYNRGLSNKYNVTGFPTVIVMDAEGKVLYRESGYGGNSAAAYVAIMKKKLRK